jgi:hypothetical protein
MLLWHEKREKVPVGDSYYGYWDCTIDCGNGRIQEREHRCF